MNHDIVLSSFYDEMEKISFDLMVGIKRLGKQLTTKAQTAKQELISNAGGATSAFKMDTGKKFVKQQKLQGEGLGQLQGGKIDDLADDTLIQTNKDGVQGIVDKGQIEKKTDKILKEMDTPQRREENLASLKQEFDLDDEAVARLKNKSENGQPLTREDIVEEIDYQEYRTKGLAGEEMRELNDIENIVSKSTNATFNDAREQALKQAKMELGIADDATFGTAENIQQFVTLNPNAEAALDTSEMLTYAGINALGFAGRNAEAIAKGTALTGGAIGLYNILD